MIIEFNDKNIKRIKNVKLASYAAMYLDIYNDYLKQITGTGLNMAAPYDAQFIKNKKKALVSKGAISRNNGYSLYVNRISEACEACQKGIGSITFFIDLNCIRKCFFCFNPNQENYSYFLKIKGTVYPN